MSNTIFINNSTVNGCTDRRTHSIVNNNTTNNYELMFSLLDIDKSIWLAQKGYEITVLLAGAGMMLSRKVLLNMRR